MGCEHGTGGRTVKETRDWMRQVPVTYLMVTQNTEECLQLHSKTIWFLAWAFLQRWHTDITVIYTNRFSTLLVFNKMQTRSTVGAGWGGAHRQCQHWRQVSSACCVWVPGQPGLHRKTMSQTTPHHTTGDYWFPLSGNGYYLKIISAKRWEIVALLHYLLI